MLIALIFSFLFFFFFGCTHGLQKFLGQGLNLSCSNDNTESLPLGHQGTLI